MHWHGAREGGARRVAGVLSFVLALATAGCTSESSGDTARDARSRSAVPVVVATVEQRDVPVQARAIGTVEPFSTVAIKSQVEGQLARIHFREGALVHVGELLFTIDPRPFEAALRQAEANLARDDAGAKDAALEEERFRHLVEQDLVSKSEYDQAHAKATALRATVAADRAAIERAKLELQYCYIRSPIDGRVGELLVHEGNVFKSNDVVLAVINQVRPVYVSFAVPQNDLPEIRRRAADGRLAVEAVGPDRTRPPAAGELTFINNTVDANTGTVLLKGLFPNDDEALWPGQFVDVALTLSTAHDAVIVPAAAVQVGQQGQYVFVVTANLTAEVRPVVAGAAVTGDVIVQRGLTPGERVVVDGQLRLAHGMTVEIKDRGGGTAPNA